ncbi:hypothetical protein Sjap_004992 [Stephania japonica]|uniref:Uncharacterized protein n=1 Tax=Stephania japonica TaxID=461633 RepID=A0AAP0PJL8_9MAGN
MGFPSPVMALAPMFYFYGELRFLSAFFAIHFEMLPSHALPLEELMVLLPRLEDGMQHCFP